MLVYMYNINNSQTQIACERHVAQPMGKIAVSKQKNTIKGPLTNRLYKTHIPVPTHLLDNGTVLSHGEKLPVAHNVPTAKVVHVVTIACSLDAEILATPQGWGCSAGAAHADLGGVGGPRGIGGLLVAPTLSACEAHPASATKTHMGVLQQR